MGYKGKSDKEYQREYYLKNKKEYQRQYYLKNIFWIRLAWPVRWTNTRV